MNFSPVFRPSRRRSPRGWRTAEASSPRGLCRNVCFATAFWGLPRIEHFIHFEWRGQSRLKNERLFRVGSVFPEEGKTAVSSDEGRKCVFCGVVGATSPRARPPLFSLPLAILNHSPLEGWASRGESPMARQGRSPKPRQWGVNSERGARNCIPMFSSSSANSPSSVEFDPPLHQLSPQARLLRRSSRGGKTDLQGGSDKKPKGEQSLHPRSELPLLRRICPVHGPARAVPAGHHGAERPVAACDDKV